VIPLFFVASIAEIAREWGPSHSAISIFSIVRLSLHECSYSENVRARIRLNGCGWENDWLNKSLFWAIHQQFSEMYIRFLFRYTYVTCQQSRLRDFKRCLAKMDFFDRHM
jgi:hypothetical protein